jgi:hypothetical protein
VRCRISKISYSSPITRSNNHATITLAPREFNEPFVLVASTHELDPGEWGSRNALITLGLAAYPVLCEERDCAN